MISHTQNDGPLSSVPERSGASLRQKRQMNRETKRTQTHSKENNPSQSMKGEGQQPKEVVREDKGDSWICESESKDVDRSEDKGQESFLPNHVKEKSRTKKRGDKTGRQAQE